MKILAAHNQRISPTISHIYEARIPSRLRGYLGKSGVVSTSKGNPVLVEKHADDFARAIGGDIVCGLSPSRDAYFGVVWNSPSDINEIYALAKTKMQKPEYFEVVPDEAYRQIEIVDEEYRRETPEFPTHIASNFIENCLRFTTFTNNSKMYNLR